MSPFIGQIMMFGGNFAPRGWALCNGQLLDIASNPALFSILGTTYGGDGRTTFGLPDLRGRAAMHPGSGPGLSPRSLGQKIGTETVTLTPAQMPIHSHAVTCAAAVGDQASPAGNVPAAAPERATQYHAVGSETMSAKMIGESGGGAAHDNLQPFQCVHFIIALQGIFPSRN